MIDPLVEEARNAGQAYIESFKGDRQAMLADLEKRTRQRGLKSVSLRPKPPRKRHLPKKSA